MKHVIVGILLALVAGTCRAQNTAANYFHVVKTTFGCGNPEATHVLANPDEPQRLDAGWMRSVIAAGDCVTITPRSRWRFLWREGDLAVMAYAGTIGRPGSYYVKATDLTDSNGNHPGEATPGPGVATQRQQEPDAPHSEAPAASANAAQPPGLVQQDKHPVEPEPDTKPVGSLTSPPPSLA
jgi:hypothetical protein